MIQRVLLLGILTAFILSGYVSAEDSKHPPISRRTPILHNGRIQPFESFAQATFRLLVNKPLRLRHVSATRDMLQLLANERGIFDEPLIRLDDRQLADKMGLAPGVVLFTRNQIEPSRQTLEDLVRAAKTARDRDERPGRLEQHAEVIYARVVTLEKLAAGEWKRDIRLAPQDIPRRKIRLEILYLDLKPFQWGWMLYLAAFAILSAVSRGPLRAAGWIALAAAATLHTIGLGLRVYILGRPPVSNMFESMVYMNWILMGVAALLSGVRKSALPLQVGALVSALVMIYADLLPLDPGLGVLVPVLRSNYWLTIHVMTVVSSYGAFGLAMGLGHRHLWLSLGRKFSKKNEKASAQLIFNAIQVGVLLLGIGTVLGGIWANASWGRFWGWDPKETWALITFLGYLIVVHLHYAKKLTPFALAVSSIVGFQLVLMTWYGVNFVLGRGLHSYGFGSGGAGWILYYLAAETLFLGFVFSRKQA